MCLTQSSGSNIDILFFSESFFFSEYLYAWVMGDKFILESQSINSHYLPVITRMTNDKRHAGARGNVFGHMENGSKWLNREPELL